MTELYFRLGSMDGFTSNITADKKEGFDIPIRELMQNSLDAADGNSCRVEIVIDEIATDLIPHLDSYKKYLDFAIYTQTNKGSYGNQQKQVVTNIKSELKKKQVRVLMFADNGTGMDREGLDALIEQRSRKSEGSSGSFGVGHLKPYDLSSLRYVMYGTRKDGETQFTGVPILAGFQDYSDNCERGNIGRIVKRRPHSEHSPVFEYPDRLPDFMQKVMGDRTQGTVVCILGLSDKWKDNCETVIASHFFSALLHGGLSVRIRRGHSNDSVTELDRDRVEQVLSKVRDGRRARITRGEILSGQHTWQSFLAVKDSNLRIDPIELSSGDRVYVYIHTGDITASSVALIRSDMLVARHDTMLSSEFNALRNSDDLEPFALVIDVNKEQAGNELFHLVKAAEGPYHNRLTRGELSRDDERRLQRLFREIAEKVRERLPTIDRRGFDLPIFDSIMASASVDRKAKPVAQPGIGPPGVRPRPGPRPGPDPRPRPPPMFGRPAEAKVEAKTERAEEGWRIRVRITPTKDTQPKDCAVLSFAIAEDRDNGIAGEWLTPENVLVGGHPGTVDGLAIPLGGLARSSPLVVEAALPRPPDSARGATAGVLSFLSLKRATPPKTADADQEGSESA